jgi:tRNA U34 2-thiouridine synthase MnmA/TrmU
VGSWCTSKKGIGTGHEVSRFSRWPRKGLGLGGGRIYYVTGINPGQPTNTIWETWNTWSVQFHDSPDQSCAGDRFDGAEEFEVKIRYRDPGLPARVEQTR